MLWPHRAMNPNRIPIRGLICAAAIAAAQLACAASGRTVVFLDPGLDPSEYNFIQFRTRFEALVAPRHPDAILERRTTPSTDLEIARAAVTRVLRSHPDVVVTADAYIARAVSEQAGGLPLVFLTLAEPVTMGITDDPLAPKRNVTGYTMHVPFELKHIELLLEYVPTIRRVGVLADPLWAQEPVSKAILDESPRIFGVRTRLFDAGSPAEIASLVRGAAASIDAWYVPDTAFNRIHAQVIAQAMRAAKKPSIAGHGAHVFHGGLMMYAPDRVDPWPRLAEMVGLILSGIDARSIPIERPKRFQLHVSASAAQALGLPIPRSILLKADEIAR
jgi:putative ABC transport system substrate-binding protein